jgi:hypothetical protein
MNLAGRFSCLSPRFGESSGFSSDLPASREDLRRCATVFGNSAAICAPLLGLSLASSQLS